jgi:DNA-binding NarL/FixJ family response regulator
MSLPRVLIVDDHRAVAEGLVQILSDQFEVVATIADGRFVLEAISRLHPGIVLLDVSMPSVNGLEVLRQLRQRAPGVRVVVLTMHADASLAVEALRTGACGYVLKSGGEELLTALQVVLAGDIYLARELRAKITTLMAGAADPRQIALTPQQQEVLQLIVLGRRAREISGILGVPTGGVETIKRDLMQLLNVQSTAELVQYAIDHGLVTSP